VIEEHARTLDTAFTSYARGEAPVYAGTLHVISDLPEHELSNPSYYESNRNVIDGSVVARIVPRTPTPNATPHPLDPGDSLALEIVSDEQRLYTLVIQRDAEESSVVFSTVLAFGTYPPGSLVPGTIDGLSLGRTPERFDFDFDERYDARGWFYRVRAQGSIFRVAPDDVTKEQARTLDRERTTEGFEENGDRWARRIERQALIRVPIPEGLDFTPNDCYRRVDYALVETVDASALATSLSQVTVASTEKCCSLCIGPECIESGFRRECFP
jgi:hypothetical protein